MNQRDVEIIRDLAKKVYEISKLPVHKEKYELWNSLNSLKQKRPMVVLINQSWNEIIDESALETTDEFCRKQELKLKRMLYNWENLKDDFIFDGEIRCPYVITDTNWGISPNLHEHSGNTRGSQGFDSVILNKDDFYNKMKKPQVTLDYKASDELYKKYCDLYGDSIPIRRVGKSFFNFALMDEYIQLRGIENAMMDMIEDPDWVHEVMSFMLDGYTSRLEQLEALNMLDFNHINYAFDQECKWGNGPGGPGYTDLLPSKSYDGVKITPMDMWGHATTQIFSEVSPSMHDEFAITYEKPWLEKFSFGSYGCCEPLHNKLNLLKKIKNLRRISISPWADVEKSAEQIGKDYVFSYKPNPSVFLEPTFDVEREKKQLKWVLEATRGCNLEIIMKDIISCNKKPQRLIEWLNMAMKMVEEFI